MENIKDKIIVGIASYNEEGVIEDVIMSALQISNEIILIDNNSIDDTIKIAKKYQEVKVVTHSINQTEYKDRIKLIINNVSDKNKHILHLNCSERIDESLVNKLSLVDFDSYDAISVYRKALTDGYPTHPYHLLYLIRSILGRHKTYRIVRGSEWSEKKCRIHGEWQPKSNQRKKRFNLPVTYSGIKVYRDGDISLNERKHITYSECDAASYVRCSNINTLMRLIYLPILYFISNVPYLIFSYSTQRLISVVQHCYYLVSVQLRILKSSVVKK